MKEAQTSRAVAWRAHECVRRRPRMAHTRTHLLQLKRSELVLVLTHDLLSVSLLLLRLCDAALVRLGGLGGRRVPLNGSHPARQVADGALQVPLLGLAERGHLGGGDAHVSDLGRVVARLKHHVQVIDDAAGLLERRRRRRGGHAHRHGCGTQADAQARAGASRAFAFGRRQRRRRARMRRRVQCALASPCRRSARAVWRPPAPPPVRPRAANNNNARAHPPSAHFRVPSARSRNRLDLTFPALGARDAPNPNPASAPTPAAPSNRRRPSKFKRPPNGRQRAEKKKSHALWPFDMRPAGGKKKTQGAKEDDGRIPHFVSPHRV